LSCVAVTGSSPFPNPIDQQLEAEDACQIELRLRQSATVVTFYQSRGLTLWVSQDALLAAVPAAAVRTVQITKTYGNFERIFPK
jgi:hypothetical protein